MQEIKLPFIREDFSEGDRIYSMFHGEIKKGTVVDNRNEYEGHITVSLDYSHSVGIHLSCFIKGAGVDYCGRIPPLEQMQIGTVVSHLEDDGSRTFAEVRHIIPGERIRMKKLTGYGEYFDHSVADDNTLEDLFLDWEIED